MHQTVRKILPLFSSSYMRGLGILTRFAFTAPTVLFGESIASEGTGEYMFVEGRVITTGGEPIPGAVINTWETDGTGKQRFMSFCLMVNGRAFPIP